MAVRTFMRMIELFNHLHIYKIKIPFLMAVTMATIKELFGIYVFADWQIVGFLFVLVGLDTITGFWKAWKGHRVSSNAWGAVLEKVVLYGVVLIILHVITNFTREPEFYDHLRWVRYAGYFTLIARESLSIVENIEEIRPGTFPKWLVKRLKAIEKTGDPKDLIKNDEQ